MNQPQKYTPAEAAEHLTSTELERFGWVNELNFALIQHGIDSFKPKNTALLDFGCGWGHHLAKLKRSRPSLRYTGYEPYMTKEQTDKSIPVFKDLNSLVNKSFGYVTAIDVIEHIEDDLAALKQCHNLLSDDGILIIKVPAFMHLWSHADVSFRHYRRYTKQTITRIVEKASFEVIDSFYMFFFSYPVVLLRKWATKMLEVVGNENPNSYFHKHCPKDPLGAPSLFASWELAMITKTRLRFPFGAGVFLYARKRQAW